MADHDDPLAIARDIISATRDCGICGGSGVREIGTACACGSGKVYVYGPNVRFLAEAFASLNATPGAVEWAGPSAEEIGLNANPGNDFRAGLAAEEITHPAQGHVEPSQEAGAIAEKAAWKLIQDICACAAEFGDPTRPDTRKDVIAPIAQIIAERDLVLSMLELSRKFCDPHGPFDTMALLRSEAQARRRVAELEAAQPEGREEIEDRIRKLLNDCGVYYHNVPSKDGLVHELLALLSSAKESEH